MMERRLLSRGLLLVAVLTVLIASGCAGNGEDAARGPTEEEDTWGRSQ